jgi:hypothetical protein
MPTSQLQLAGGFWVPRAEASQLTHGRTCTTPPPLTMNCFFELHLRASRESAAALASITEENRLLYKFAMTLQ